MSISRIQPVLFSILMGAIALIAADDDDQKTDPVQDDSQYLYLNEAALEGLEGAFEFVATTFPDEFLAFMEIPNPLHNSQTPSLHEAASQGLVANFEFIATTFPDELLRFMETQDGSGSTPLYIAAIHGHVNILRTIHRLLPQNFFALLQIPNNDFRTVLHQLATDYNDSSVSVFNFMKGLGNNQIKRFCDVLQLQDAEGNTVFHLLAIHWYAHDRLRSILKRIQDNIPENFCQLLGIQNKLGETFLHSYFRRPAQWFCPSLLKFLKTQSPSQLELVKNHLQIRNKQGKTPLDSVQEKGQYFDQLLKLLGIANDDTPCKNPQIVICLDDDDDNSNPGAPSAYGPSRKERPVITINLTGVVNGNQGDTASSGTKGNRSSKQAADLQSLTDLSKLSTTDLLWGSVWNECEGVF